MTSGQDFSVVVSALASVLTLVVLLLFFILAASGPPAFCRYLVPVSSPACCAGETPVNPPPAYAYKCAEHPWTKEKT